MAGRYGGSCRTYTCAASFFRVVFLIVRKWNRELFACVECGMLSDCTDLCYNKKK
ncbi:hypothetical protein SELSPUOL_00603 [Selenomonas sputigena ATCC 35185]|uniref:Uncharacterized protein n=1 Tax=Selenomonas sputigena (strain ATCC 35185 / DSM 20758 / CCUG 44933 / VPI D19B-28) TaxID=546271 RepID=C9LT23_SELS3|nr:hypothetical protein SELSPUOL_00603 [Selenomonas sputigena ATCC 35185]